VLFGVGTAKSYGPYPPTLASLSSLVNTMLKKDIELIDAGK
jgi:hypothetical protein